MQLVRCDSFGRVIVSLRTLEADDGVRRGEVCRDIFSWFLPFFNFHEISGRLGGMIPRDVRGVA